MKQFTRVVLIAALVLAGCGSDGNSGSKRALNKTADEAAINNIEVIFHRAVSNKNIDEIMSIFTDDANFTAGGQTYVGKEQIKKFFETSGPFKAENHWVSATPAYKIRVSANGNDGTLYFECHYIDVNDRVVKSAVSADIKVARNKDRWLVTKLVAGPASLT
jgi:ketosteroid isomerase-like protein